MVLKQGPVDIENWSAGKLAALYINSFIVSKADPSEASQLDHIAEVLSRKEFEDRMNVFHHFKCGLRSFIADQDFESASVYRDMILHYNMHVLG